MAVTTTPLGFKKPDGNELVRGGDNAIADNAQLIDDLLRPALSRLGQVEANAQLGGSGPGLSADALNPGLYFIAADSPLVEDPANPGYYTF